jgi:phosphoglycolate phosphatase
VGLVSDTPAAGTGPLLVWGFDGTVVDSYPAIRAAVDVALDEHGIRPAGPPWVTEAILRSLVGLSLDRIFGRLVYHLDPDPKLVQSLVMAYREAFRAVGPAHATLLPGIAELLASLRAQGAVSVVASSDGCGADVLLDRFGIAEHFAGVVCDDDVARHHRKPDSGLVLSACAAHGYDPEDAVVIGDSVFDVEMGQSAGADTVWVTWGNQSRGDLLERTPTHLAEDLDELGSVLHRYIGEADADAGGLPSSGRPHHVWMANGGRTQTKVRRRRRWVLSRCAPSDLN